MATLQDVQAKLTELDAKNDAGFKKLNDEIAALQTSQGASPADLDAVVTQIEAIEAKIPQ